MVIEALILYSCSVNKGCQPAIQYYYTQSQSLQHFIADVDRRTKDESYRKFIELIVPIAQYGAGTRLILKVNKEFSIETSNTYNAVLFKHDF